MDVEVHGVTGEHRYATGVAGAIRLGSYAEQIVNDVGLGRYFESAKNNRLFSLSAAAAGVAPAAANLSPLTANTGQPLVGIFNPLGSNKAAVILGAGANVTNVVTTQTSSMLVWNFIPVPTGITATGTPAAVRADLSSVAGPSVMKHFVNAAITGSVTATMLRPLKANGQMSTNPAVAQAVEASFYEETAGSIIVPPGAFLGLAAHAASASLYACWMEWAEIEWTL